MWFGNFTADSVRALLALPTRSAKNFFDLFPLIKGLHPQPLIYRWVPRRSTFRTRKVCQGGQPSHLHSASVRLVGARMGRAVTGITLR
jgi:hypothetical protein